MAGDARPNTVVLLSMGYDSLSTWHQLGRPSAVHFDIGSRYTRAEKARYEKLRKSFPQLLPVQDLSWLGTKEEGDAWVPLRNLLMTVHAAALGFDDIVMSAPADWAADKRLLFTLTTTLAMRVAQPGAGYRVRRPFSHWTKARLIAATPTGLLEEFAYSCYEGADLPCGRCSACGRATIAHLAAGRASPTPPPAGLSFREFTDLRRGQANGSRLSQTARMHLGELLLRATTGLGAPPSVERLP
jgi:7-cyano-7-deazaguanine synthase in queuosine biosynthesis